MPCNSAANCNPVIGNLEVALQTSWQTFQTPWKRSRCYNIKRDRSASRRFASAMHSAINQDIQNAGNQRLLHKHTHTSVIACAASSVIFTFAMYIVILPFWHCLYLRNGRLQQLQFVRPLTLVLHISVQLSPCLLLFQIVLSVVCATPGYTWLGAVCALFVRGSCTVPLTEIFPGSASFGSCGCTRSSRQKRAPHSRVITFEKHRRPRACVRERFCQIRGRTDERFNRRDESFPNLL